MFRLLECFFKMKAKLMFRNKNIVDTMSIPY